MQLHKKQKYGNYITSPMTLILHVKALDLDLDNRHQFSMNGITIYHNRIHLRKTCWSILLLHVCMAVTCWHTCTPWPWFWNVTFNKCHHFKMNHNPNKKNFCWSVWLLLSVMYIPVHTCNYHTYIDTRFLTLTCQLTKYKDFPLIGSAVIVHTLYLYIQIHVCISFT